VVAKSIKKKKEIYLDNASATPVDRRVLDVLEKVSKINYANAGAIHEFGIKSRELLNDARSKIAKILNSHQDEIIFTSGATEANNLAVRGILSTSGSHIITTNVEHPSILEVCKYLEENKIAEVTYVPVEANGIVDPKNIKEALRGNTVLVSVMYANNEIGTIQPIRAIAKVVRIYNKKNKGKNQPNVLLHTDATQAINYLPIDVIKLGVDLMSFNAGKIYGPKGVGVLFIKKETPIRKIIFGGEQEMGLRAGTENLAGAIGLAEALEIAEKIKDNEVKRLTKLRDYFITQMSKTVFDIKLNGDLKERLPNNVNITIPKIPSDLLVVELSAKGIYISEKSACKSGDKAPSHVISALRSVQGLPLDDGSLRFSLGRDTKKSDIDIVVRQLESILQKLVKWYN